MGSDLHFEAEYRRDKWFRDEWPKLQRELRAARRVVEAARAAEDASDELREVPEFETLRDALRAYDEVCK